jgi:NAD(P)-dependent dehydrogenase (short-subunit alcohol dehydrogenase family)
MWLVTFKTLSHGFPKFPNNNKLALLSVVGWWSRTMSDPGLRGKVIVITGASSGFGKGAALEFAKAGASVVIAARRDELLNELVQECEAAGGRALAVQTDVSQQNDMQALAQQAVAAFGRIDVWINNAGIGALGEFWDIPLTDHARVIEVNLLGVIYGSYFALLQFRQQGSGTLINTASGLGKIPAPYYSTYTASKYGVVGLSASLRQELSEANLKDIHVCTVLPMAMDTPWFDHASNYTGHEVKPIPPLYDPQEVIDVYVRLASQPETEVIVGGAGKVMSALHSIFPGMVEGMMSKEVDVVQMETAPHDVNSSNSIHEPTDEGTGVYGGRLDK